MISTHILNTSTGNPASDVEVKLERQGKTTWEEVETSKTNTDGRISFECDAIAGTYRLLFDIESYFKQTNTEHFFIETPVAFRIKDTNRKYHVPLLLNPFGYSSYRGS